MSAAGASADYAALANASNDLHYGGSDYTVEVFDLRTGALVPGRGGEAVSCSDYATGCVSDIDDVVVGDNGFSAVHTLTGQVCPPLGSTLCPTEQIVSSDSTGVHTLDSYTGSDFNEPPVLTNLNLNGSALSWLHDGSPRSASLQ